MNLIHLRYFVELSRTGSYTQAARRLCITQPSLSHAMAQLEEELGTELFRRQGRTTALTPLGEQFLTSVCHSLDILDRGIEEVRQAARGAGLLRIGLCFFPVTTSTPCLLIIIFKTLWHVVMQHISDI